MAVFTFLLLQASFHNSSLPQPPSLEAARNFILALAEGRPGIERLFREEDVSNSHRLGISYEGLDTKLLIGEGMDSSIANGIRSGSLKFDIRIDSSRDGYARVLLEIPARAYQHAFYFRNEKAISRVSYFTRAYHSWRSEHFKFLISDTGTFNRYSVDRLEKYFDSISLLLQFTREDMALLAKEKIVYVLCKDMNEIEHLTGFKTMGMYILAYDCVASTYNCHYHELLHLLINFKLRHIPLYTHPFLQEGFAVAFGGRGGKEPEIILDAGFYLAKSGMVEVSSLLKRAEFMEQDASVTYPVAGIYNAFLVQELGIGRYLQLYRKYSMKGHRIDASSIDTSDLPSSEKWNAFLEGYVQHRSISLSSPGNQGEVIIQGNDGAIRESGDTFTIRLRDTLLLTPPLVQENYRSIRFSEMFPTRVYHGEKYAITAGPQEIAIYNLYTNNLIANIVGTFCLPPMTISTSDGMFEFQVKKSIFDELKGSNK